MRRSATRSRSPGRSRRRWQICSSKTAPRANEGQIDDYTAIVEQLTGKDAVTWTLSGTVYHLCADASAVNQQSADNQIYAGTVSDAHTAGKEGLTLKVEQELSECGLTAPDNLDAIESQIRDLRSSVDADNAG